MDKLQTLIKEKRIQCPNCSVHQFKTEGTIWKGLIECLGCNGVYVINNGVFQLLNSFNDDVKNEMQSFWTEVLKKAYKQHDIYKDRIIFEEELCNLEDLFIHRKHISVTEMPINELKGTKILEIGSGAGSHSSLFSYKGGDVTSVDITLERAIETSSKLATLSADNIGNAFQADAEALPFQNESFDIIFSNGVLHHTEDTNSCIQEVHRVLKKDGIAVIMLYAKNSFLYWFNLFLFRGLILGGLFRDKRWLGRNTEWMSEEKQEIFNPITKVYSSSDLEIMFKNFTSISLRKGGFTFQQIPLIGPVLSRLVGMHTGYSKAGKLIYNEDWRKESSFELLLGRYIGFDYMIKVKK
tara:strand:- start:1083 stop:2141 length:1059 start_codon:yes stop_codon:yes gene_type:complete